MKKYLHQLIMLLAAAVLTTGCIKEDLDDCHNATIYFRYLADGDKDVLFQYISKVDLYVFDGDGHFMEVRTYHQDGLSNSAVTPSFRLEKGKRYKMVAVGNAYDATEVENLYSADFNQIYIQYPNWKEIGHIVRQDNNYMGQIEFTMPSQEGMMYRDTVTLHSSHVDTHIEIHGLPAPAGNLRENGVPYELRIDKANAQCSFNNEINRDESAKATVYPDLIYDSEQNCYRTHQLAVFRMDYDGVLDENHCQHTLTLVEKATGKVLLDAASVYEYIRENEHELNLLKQEAMLPISIVFDQLSVEIKLPGWYVEDVEPGWE